MFAFSKTKILIIVDINFLEKCLKCLKKILKYWIKYCSMKITRYFQGKNNRIVLYNGQIQPKFAIFILLGANTAQVGHSLEIFPIKYQHWIKIVFSLETFAMKIRKISC